MRVRRRRARCETCEYYYVIEIGEARVMKNAGGRGTTESVGRLARAAGPRGVGADARCTIRRRRGGGDARTGKRVWGVGAVVFVSEIGDGGGEHADEIVDAAPASAH